MTDKADYPQAAFGGDTIPTVTLTEAEQAAFASGWNRAIEAAYQAALTCNGALNNAGAVAVKVSALSMPAPAQAWRVKPLADLVRDALIFANWAAGEGFSPEDVPAPEDFLMRYSDATGDEDWDTFAERISAQIAALTPDTEGGQ